MRERQTGDHVDEDFPLQRSSLLTCHTSVTNEVRQVSPAAQRASSNLTEASRHPAETVRAGYAARCVKHTAGWNS